MNGRSLLLSSNKTTLYFKEWVTASSALKKIYCLYKNLMLQIDPLNKSFFQNLQYPEKKIKTINPRKSISLEKVAVPKVTLAYVYSCYSEKVLYLMNNCNCEGT